MNELCVIIKDMAKPNFLMTKKSQQALKLQQEQNKRERKVKSQKQKLAEVRRMFELKQQKKKEKHRGR